MFLLTYLQIFKMNKLVIVLFLVFNFGNAQDQNYLEFSKEFEINEKVYLFGDNVKLRKSPSTNSEIITLLKIGEPLKIVEKSTETLMYNGIDSPWYKVKYNNQQGYVIGGLISATEKKDGNVRFLFNFEIEDSKLYVTTRVLTDTTSKYFENKSEFRGDNYLFTIHFYDNKGIEDINNILFVNYVPESCGANSGGYYLFLDDNGLYKVLDLRSGADIGFWESETLIFPNDPNGEKDKIIFLKEDGQYPDDEESDDEPIWEKTSSIKIDLKWVDSKVSPNPRTVLDKIGDY